MTGNLSQFETTYSSQQVISNTQLMGLIYSSGLANKLSLSNPATIVLSSLAYHFNTIRKDMFPTQELIAEKTNLSLSSVKRGINELLNCGLIIKAKRNKSSTNLYKFTGKFFDLINLNHATAQIEPTHEVRLTPPNHEHKKDNMRKEQTSFQKTNINKEKMSNDDVFKKNPSDLVEYKNVLTQLEKWGFTGGKFAIKKYGIQKLKDLIKIVEEKQPASKGAYLRSLLNLPNVIEPMKNNVCCEAKEEPLINQMLKHKYWRHILSGKILQVLPDIGQHLLIRFNAEDQTIIFIENNFTDKLESFEVATKEDFIKQNSQQENCKLDKDQIIKDMIEQGKVEEAETLSELWKIKA